MGIYEDVAALQTQMTEVMSSITNIENELNDSNVTVLEANNDLDTLGIGAYIIPNSTVASSLLNKPNGVNTSTGYIKVVAGGNDGQLMMYYYTCKKTDATYYYRAYYQGTWGDWNAISVIDTGWNDITLNTGISAYSESQKPRYRRIGKEVFLTGVFTGVTSANVLIGTLPTDCRPSKKMLIPIASVGQIISRMTVDVDGTIMYNRSTIEPIVAENYHSLACTFCVD